MPKKDVIVLQSLLITKRPGRLMRNFLRGNITDMLSKPPAVPEWVNDLPLTVPPELVLQRLQNGSSRVYGTFPESLDIFRGEVQDNGSATDCQW